jgi:hypothetical protein
MEDLDFFQIAVKEKKGGGYEAYPDFVVGRSKDLMVRAKNFYAIWDEESGLWSTDEYDVQRIVDSRLKSYAAENKDVVGVKWMRSFGSNGQSTFRKFMSQIGDNSHQLDETLTFRGTKVTKKDYVSKRLPYDLTPGDISAWDEMVGTLYKPEERAKIEWAIGAIVAGESKKIQKFLVLYGPPGAGKGTMLDILMMLFDSYVTTFDAKALGSNGNQFAAAAFAGNPLVAIQHDGDLSRIEDNTILNSIVSHEVMKVNEKYKPAYDSKINAFLFMGTNKPVKITDAQSGLIRRLIDVHPSGTKLSPKRYHAVKDRIGFELGAIAHHCLQVYRDMGGANAYSGYQPMEMMYKTNAFFNFIEAHYDIFEKQDGVTGKQAWNLYKEYCQEANIERMMSMYAFKSELGNYFEEFLERHTLPDGQQVRSWYSGFKAELYKVPLDDDAATFTLALDETISLLNLELAEMPAQYAKADGSPSKYWDDSERIIGGQLKRPRPSQVVDTYLKDLDPYKEHFVKVPDNHIVMDFDLEDEDGNKSLARNLEAAALWPPTYAELSKSGLGVHLHYDYDGDTSLLDPVYAPGIETKVYRGNGALRRRLSQCNNVPIARISSGLPLKEKKRVLEQGQITNAKALRELIARNLRKEIHPGTKPSIDFIHHILEEVYASGMVYDVSDLKQKITLFANNSSNKAMECLKVVSTMRWKSEEDIAEAAPVAQPVDERLVFFDVESYPNLFMICWKFEEEKPSKSSVVVMINPKPHEVEALMNLKLVGFNSKNYDNHMLWAAAMGYTPVQLNRLSQKIIAGGVGAKFGEAYRLGHTDVYDYSTVKQGLKKFQIELGLEHREMDLPWDQPVPENRIMDVAAYCTNDVVSLEQVHKARIGDYKARLILADLSGLAPIDTTAKHTAAIVFGRDKNPQRQFVYTDLSKEFPGYYFGPVDGVKGNPNISTYRGEILGEGGLVRAKPGIHENVALLDVASMHPTSIGHLNLFGEYTGRYMALVEAQLAIKHFYPDDEPSGWKPDFDAVKEILEGKLRPYIEDIERLDATDRLAAKKAAKELRYGLKIAMNIVYGLTSAKFDNPFRDIRNVDNIVAKRGALFMIDLLNFVEERGFVVAHIKTDSIKIPNATQEIIDEVKLFAQKYGYDMEHEATYSKFALVNDAVYVAKKDECITNCWSATGAQFQHPYVFKKLFGYSDDINFYDLGETRHVQQGALYLDFGAHNYAAEPHYFGNVEGTDIPYAVLEGGGYIDHAIAHGKQVIKAGRPAEEAQNLMDHAVSKLIHVGRTGRFTPVKEGYGGGQLWRIKDGKHYAVQGTKGRLWADSNIAMDLPGDAIDYDYFEDLVTKGRESLEKFLEGTRFSTIEDFLS